MFVAHQPTPKETFGTVAEAVRRLFEAGVTLHHFQLIINDPRARTRLAGFWRTGSPKLSTSLRKAQEIMGESFLGVDQISQRFPGVTRKDVTMLEVIPYRAEMLEVLRYNHVLIAVPAGNVLSLLSSEGHELCRMEGSFEPGSRQITAWAANRVVGEYHGPAWYLLPINPPTVSCSGLSEMQIEIVPLYVALYAAIAFYNKDGRQLFGKLGGGRASTEDSLGYGESDNTGEPWWQHPTLRWEDNQIVISDGYKFGWSTSGKEDRWITSPV